MQKRIISILLVAVMVCTSMVGCGKKKEPEKVDIQMTDDSTYAIEEVDPEDNAPVGSFDAETTYQEMQWSLGSMMDSVELTAENYYGKLVMAGGKDGMLLTIDYNMDHLAEIGSDVKENHGSSMALYIPKTGATCLYDDTEDKTNPKKLAYGSAVFEETTDIEEEVSFKSMLGDDITFNEYKGSNEENGKTIDICSVTLRDEQNKENVCDAYIDRETQTLLKLVKVVDSSDKYDYSLVLQPLESGTIEKPSWVDSCVEATEDQVWDIFGAMMGMALIMSDQDASNGLLLNSSNPDDVDYPDEDADLIKEKKGNEEYWISKLGGYQGYSSYGNGSVVTVLDGDGGEHTFIWDVEQKDFIEDESKYVAGDPDAYAEGWDVGVDDEYKVANPKFEWDTKLYDHSYWENRLGHGYMGYGSTENGKHVTIYCDNDESYNFVWDSDLQDYVED